MSSVMIASNADELLSPHLNESSRLVRRGMAVVLCGLLPVAAWMAWAPLSSAVVAPAYVKVDLNRRSVQHAEGGIVRSVLVRDGQKVRQGEPLLVLGDVSVDAEKNRLGYRVHTEHASLARFQAEESMARAVIFTPEITEIAKNDARLAEHLAKERALFNSRRETLASQVGLLRLQREKVSQEIIALRAQIEQAIASMKFQKSELETNRRLLKDGFISATRIAQLEGIVADYGVKLEERRSELARAEQRLVDADLRIHSLHSDYRQQASDQIKIITARLLEIEQEQRKSVDASTRQVIVAPASGEVMDLKYATPGAIIPPRETIADIVPADSRLVIEARIRPEDIGRIHDKQMADIRFTSFRYRTTPLVEGKVIYVSADRLVDRATNAPYYSVMIEAATDSLVKAGGLKLSAGMPAEVYIKGEERTPLEYLVEPVTGMLNRAARER